MSGHTKGPYQISPSDVLVWAGEKLVADCWPETMVVHAEVPEHEAKANALLFCAAQDLLEALKDLLEAGRMDNAGDYSAATRKARAAIAKAEGRHD